MVLFLLFTSFEVCDISILLKKILHFRCILEISTMLAIFLQYFAKRFDFRPTIITGDFLLILSQVIYVGIATFAPATAMQICK